jgi:hypothetical protein
MINDVISLVLNNYEKGIAVAGRYNIVFTVSIIPELSEKHLLPE